MKASASSEPQRGVEAGNRAPKVNKACVPCRLRKVKCDAAVVGLPCSSCKAQQRVDDCTPLIRKGRSRKGGHVPATPNQAHTSESPATRRQSDRRSENQLQAHPTPNSLVHQSPGQNEPDLLYLRILNDAVEETPTSGHSMSNAPLGEQISKAKLSQLDDIDREYLAKKGVFDLPPPQHLDIFVKTYFDHVHPFCAVISRVDFVRRYKSGDYSLLLLSVILATSSIHAPADLLSACGFNSRSAAQEVFFSRARLLYDFAAEDDPILTLQACIVLTLVILDHPTDQDFGYWFHNAVSLATKLNVRDIVFEKAKPRRELKVYNRVWWALDFLDIFHVSINPRRSRLLGNGLSSAFKLDDDWEDEDVSADSSGLLSPVTPQHKAAPFVLTELARTFEECLAVVKKRQQQDPGQTMHPLDAWRHSLASKMHIDEQPRVNVHYLNIQAMSYRFECILCRLIRRTWPLPGHANWREWAKTRLRSAIMELDTIMMRVLASGTLYNFPIPFVTIIPALLALHIESALDPTETDLVRSMSRISLSQTMLLIKEGREIPVLKRALPVFEEILASNKLSTHLEAQDNNLTYASTSPHIQVNSGLPQMEQWQNNPSLDVDFLGFDFFDDWQQFAPLDFST